LFQISLKLNQEVNDEQASYFYGFGYIGAAGPDRGSGVALAGPGSIAGLADVSATDANAICGADGYGSLRGLAGVDAAADVDADANPSGDIDS